MNAKRHQLAGVIIGYSALLWTAIAIVSHAATPPYNAPVVREAEFAILDRQIEVTLKGVFHAGTKTAVASCEPFLKDMIFDARHVQLIQKVRGGGADSVRRRGNLAEAAKIVLPPFLTGPQGVECVFILRDEEPSSKPASQRTSAPLRTRMVTDNLPGIREAIALDPAGAIDFAAHAGANAACPDADEKIGPDGLPVDPAAVVVVGDIVYANVTAPTKIYTGGSSYETRWYVKDGLSASDFDLFALQPSGQRKKLSVSREDFSREKAPISVGVLMDASGSMREAISRGEPGSSENLTKRSLAETAADRLLSSALQVGVRYVPPKDPKDSQDKGTSIPLSNAFVLNFNEEFSLNGEENAGIHADHFIKDATRLNSWITGKAGGGIVLRHGTRLLDAVYRAAYEMNRVTSRELCNPNPRVTEMRNEMEKRRVFEGRSSYTFQETYGLKHLLQEVATVKRRRVLFVISDGLDNRSKLLLDTVVDFLAKSGVILYGINFVKDADEERASVLPELARATGGQALLINLEISTRSIEDKVSEFTSTVLRALEYEYELTFDETLESCSKLEIHAYDTSKLWETWRDMEKTYKRLTCQLDPPKSDLNSTDVRTTEPEKPACVPDPKAFLVPWDSYYFANYRDKDIPELQVTHRTHVGPCSPAEIRGLTNSKATTNPPYRPRRK